MLSCIHSTNIYQAPTVCQAQFWAPNTHQWTRQSIHLSTFPFYWGIYIEQVLVTFNEYLLCVPAREYLAVGHFMCQI